MTLTTSDPVITTRPSDPETEIPPNKSAHIVHDLDKVAEAIINRTPLMALCGYVFVPEQSPRDKPVCPACKDVWHEIKDRLPDGNDTNRLHEEWT